MKRTVRMALLLWTVCSATVFADSWAKPGPEEYFSPKGTFRARRLPPPEHPFTKAIIQLIRVDAAHGDKVVWENRLDYVPHQIIVTEQGQVIGVDKYANLGYAHSLVIWSDRGKKLADYALEELLLLTKEQIRAHVQQSISSRWWAQKASFNVHTGGAGRDTYSLLIVKLDWGLHRVVDLETGEIWRDFDVKGLDTEADWQAAVREYRRRYPTSQPTSRPATNAAGATSRPAGSLLSFDLPVPVESPDEPVIVVYVNYRYSMREPGFDTKTPRVIVAAWKDGRLLWSKQPIEGGPPYFTAKVNPQPLLDLLDGLDKQDMFAPPGFKWASWGPDASFTVIALADGHRRLYMESWHELMEQHGKLVATHRGVTALGDQKLEEVLAKQPEEHRRPRRIWAEIRRTLGAMVPEKGEPVADSEFEMWRVPPEAE